MANEVRLIDANALPYENQVLSCDDEWCLKVSEIEKVPTIDPESLRQKGKWIEPYWDDQWQVMIASCSNCHDRGEVRVRRNENGKMVIDSPHCPNCGADMRGEEDEQA